MILPDPAAMIRAGIAADAWERGNAALALGMLLLIPDDQLTHARLRLVANAPDSASAPH